MDALKGTTRRVYLNDDDIEKLKQLSDATFLSQVEILTQIVHAGLQSISENGNRLTLPLRFTIGSEPDSTRQSKPLTTPRK